MDLTPEGPFKIGERLTAERVEAVMQAAAQSALTASPDWTGGFRIPVSRWLTTLSETIESGAAATDEHHGALALANLVLRGLYQAGREDAARVALREYADSYHYLDGGHGPISTPGGAIDAEAWCACGAWWSDDEGGCSERIQLLEAISLGRSSQGVGDNPEEQRP